MSRRKTITFSPGPAKVPDEVLAQVQREFLDFDGTGLSVIEIGRNSPALRFVFEAAQGVRDVLSVPDSYEILFFHGGAVGQMSAVPLNLAGSSDATVDYVVTGSWSEMAVKEARKFCRVNVVNEKLLTDDNKISVQDQSKWKLTPGAKYLYFCSNETIHGVEIEPESLPPEVVLVCDATSNLFTKPIDVSKYGVIFAATQKNAGCSGQGIVIVRRDLIQEPMKVTPRIFDWKLAMEEKFPNTPATFPIYLVNLVMQWILKEGGLQEMGRKSMIKSSLIYDVIDSSGGFYYNRVDKTYRSRTNLPFRIGGMNGDEQLENKFLQEAEEQGMVQLKQHLTAGGIRASMYVALKVEDAQVLADFMKDFEQRNKK